MTRSKEYIAWYQEWKERLFHAITARGVYDITPDGIIQGKRMK